MPRVVVALLLVLAACGRGSFTVQPAPQPVEDTPATRLRVMLPPAQPQGDEAGRVVAGRIVQVLQQTHADVQLIASNDRDAALAEARAAQAAYLVEPTVTAWAEGHAPPFTADQLGVRLELVDVASGAVRSTTTFTNASSIFEISDVPPSALLDARFDDAVRALFAR